MKEDENMQADKQLLDSLQRLSKAELSRQDRAEILGRLDQRISDWERKSSKRIRSHRFGVAVWAAVGVTAAGTAGFLLFNMSLMQPVDPTRPGDQTHHTMPPVPPPATNPSYAPNVQEPLPNQTSQDTEQRALVEKIANLAREGLVPDCKFAADKSLIDEIQKEWGEPAHTGVAGKGIYATYPQRGFDFGFNKGAQVFDVRSYTATIKQIKYSTVKAVLGEPVQVNSYDDPKQSILIYKAGDLYELQFIFPEPTEQLTDPSLDHISVFCPKDATPNSMAQ